MTPLLDSVLAIFLAGVLNVALIARIASRSAHEDGPFLARVYASSVLCRALLAILLNVFAAGSAFAVAFWGDSGTYDIGATMLLRSWHGEVVDTSSTAFLSGYGFFYVVAAVYYVFGRNQLLMQLINATIGAATILVIYGIAAHLFNRSAARWAASFMAFFPQMLFWSAGMYKDPSVLLCIAACMYAVLHLRDALTVRHLVLFLCAAFGLLTLRFYIFYFVVAAGVGTFAFGARGSMVQRVASLCVLVGAIVGGLTFGVRHEALETQAAFMTLDQVQVTRADQATWGHSAYGTEYDVTTVSGALRAVPLGLVYLLFSPFPWAISSVRQLLTVPETLVWYALMPAFVRGLVHSIRYRFRDVLPILVFTLTLTLAYALAQGNVGTAYRQRTQITMFFFLFMGVGIVERRRLRAARDRALAGA
jgi:4-amino-4-deoxy-L-arabinose transferase-like glycosyltransferase